MSVGSIPSSGRARCRRRNRRRTGSRDGAPLRPGPERLDRLAAGARQRHGGADRLIDGAIVKKIFEPVGGLVYPFGGNYSADVWIKVLDTQLTAPSLDRLHVDWLKIGLKDPEPQNSGCTLRLTPGPTLTVTASPAGKTLDWTPVSGAGEYWVFRTEGHAGCDLGMTRVAKVPGTSYT